MDNSVNNFFVYFESFIRKHFLHWIEKVVGPQHTFDRQDVRKLLKELEKEWRNANSPLIKSLASVVGSDFKALNEGLNFYHHKGMKRS